MYVRPKILLRDKQACEHIVKKLEEEEITQAIQQQWYMQERQETRQRLMRQKEKNIQIETKSGVIKDYLPVGLSLAVQDSIEQGTIAPGVRLSMATTSDQILSQSLQPMSQEVINTACINLGSRDQEGGYISALDQSKPKANAAGDNEVVYQDSAEPNPMESLENIKMKAQLANLQRKNKTSEGTRRSMGFRQINDSAKPGAQVMDSMDSPRLRQNVPLTSQQVSADPSNTMIDINDYASLQNTFKVSHLVRPKHYQTSQRLLNLQKPKSTARQRYKDVYDMQDFRGLLYADYKQTIQGAFSKTKNAQSVDIKKKTPSTNAAAAEGENTTTDFQTTEYRANVFKSFVNTTNSTGKKSSMMPLRGNMNSNTQTMDFAGSYGTGQTIKRPLTAFFAKKNAAQQQTISAGVNTARLGARSNYNIQDAVVTPRTLQSKNRRTAGVTDPEGIEALNAMDQFDSTYQKKVNRYPKNHLEEHLKLDETMQAKIENRTTITSSKVMENMANYSQKRLA